MDPLDVLKNEFADRRKGNRAYSLRAFARDCALSSGALSQILSGKRPLTARTARKIAASLLLTPERRRNFLKPFSGRIFSQKMRHAGFHELEEERLKAMQEWHHGAILSLLKLDAFRPDPRWIGARLGIPAEQAADALARLERLGLVRRHGTRLERTHERYATTSDVPSAAVRKANADRLQLALAALDLDVSKRDITSMTIASDVARLPEVKELIRRFRRDLLEFMEQGPRNALFALNIQLFPLTRED